MKTGYGDSVFTTGQVARLCKVAPRTVAKWIDSGRLKGYRIPAGGGRPHRNGHEGSAHSAGDRRIPRAALLAFLRENGMPSYGLAEGLLRVLVLTPDASLFGRIQHGLSTAVFCTAHVAADAFEAGEAWVTYQPTVAVFDLATGRSAVLECVRALRRRPGLQHLPIFAVACEDEQPGALVQAGFTDVFQRPFDAGVLVERILGFGR